jgi:putative hydrolase of the HAD superfamily
MSESPSGRLSRLRAVLLDLDGTLVDRDSAHLRYLERIVAARPEAVPEGSSVRETVQALVYADDRGRKSRDEFARIAVSRLPGLGWTPEEFLRDYFENIGGLVVRRDWVLDLVRSLRRSYRIAVVSNGGSRNQRRKLESAGLESSFDAVLISDEVGAAKPDPEIFELALRELTVEPSHAMHVGDDEVNDVMGARRAGILTCWVSRGLTFPGTLAAPDFTIESVADLDRLLTLDRG